MMEFVRLLHRDMDKLAEALSREHGKTRPDAKGDIIRGLEVAEFCIGAPHLLKGEFTEGARAGHRHPFRAPTVRRRGGHHAVQLSRHDSHVEILPCYRDVATPSFSNPPSATRPCR